MLKRPGLMILRNVNTKTVVGTWMSKGDLLNYLVHRKLNRRDLQDGYALTKIIDAKGDLEVAVDLQEIFTCRR
jgi:hypothetical protein